MKPEMGVVGPASSHVLETEIDGDVSIYDPKTEQVTVLNGTASDIWRLADGSLTVDQIADLLAASYQVEPDKIREDISHTVASLRKAGLIEST